MCRFKGAPTFTPQFDTVYASLKRRLISVTTIEQCGQWNAKLADDFASDSEFILAAEQLNASALQQCFPDQLPPVIDHVSLLDVAIKHELSIIADFRLWLFVECNGRLGHSAAPARFTVTRLPHDTPVFSATFGCGLRDDSGRFWYPRQVNHFGSADNPPETKNGWAFWQTKTYGYTSLLRWKSDRAKNNGKQ